MGRLLMEHSPMLKLSHTLGTESSLPSLTLPGIPCLEDACASGRGCCIAGSAWGEREEAMQGGEGPGSPYLELYLHGAVQAAA